MFIPAQDHHVGEILRRGLRAADVQECLDVFGTTPEVELPKSVALSERVWAWTQDDGSTFAMFGVVRCADLPEAGIPWLLATEDYKKHRKGFVRHVNEYVTEMGRGFKYLTNFVAEDHEASLRWLKYAGFTIIERFPEFGLARKPFLQFYKTV